MLWSTPLRLYRRHDHVPIDIIWNQIYRFELSVLLTVLVGYQAHLYLISNTNGVFTNVCRLSLHHYRCVMSVSSTRIFLTIVGINFVLSYSQLIVRSHLIVKLTSHVAFLISQDTFLNVPLLNSFWRTGGVMVLLNFISNPFQKSRHGTNMIWFEASFTSTLIHYKL